MDKSALWFSPAQEPSAGLARDLAGAIGDRAVDQHAFDTDRERLRLFERRHVLDSRRVEHDEVGVRAFENLTAIIELEIARGKAAHLVHGGLERKQSQLAAVMPQHAGESSP